MYITSCHVKSFLNNDCCTDIRVCKVSKRGSVINYYLLFHCCDKLWTSLNQHWGNDGSNKPFHWGKSLRKSFQNKLGCQFLAKVNFFHPFLLLKIAVLTTLLVTLNNSSVNLWMPQALARREYSHVGWVKLSHLSYFWHTNWLQYYLSNNDIVLYVRTFVLLTDTRIHTNTQQNTIQFCQ